jgi:Flp pilus assembly protein TadG
MCSYQINTGAVKKGARIMRRKPTTQKGVSAVGFALVLPILTLITFSIIEFKEVFTRPVADSARPSPAS